MTKKVSSIKKTFLIILSTLLIMPCWSQPAGLKNARTVAENFYALKNKQKSSHTLQLYMTDQQLFRQKSGTGKIRYYVFNDESNGFVIVSGDYRCLPVLAYSTESIFDSTDMPENIRQWMQNYCEEMESLLNGSGAEALPTDPLWQDYLEKRATTIAKAASSVGPLIKTKWNQGAPYNDSCPYDANAFPFNFHSPSGCVATAMAQVLKYWNHPIKGNGFRTYTSNYGTHTVYFNKGSYDWSHMTNTYGNNSTEAEKKAVAQLMYHCGVSVEMNYGTNESSAKFYVTDWQMTHNNYNTDVHTALMRNFGCDTAFGFYRSNFPDSNTWISMLKTELDSGRPILYDGYKSSSGHAFILDGYDSNNLFHVNWGWGGKSDGYFRISVLNPNNQGAGGSTGGYNRNQEAIFVHPVIRPVSPLYDLRLCSPLSISDSLVIYSTPFNIGDNITNYDTSDFDGYIGVALYKENGNYIGVEGKTHLKLKSGASMPDFRCHIHVLNTLKEGKYVARLVYSTENDRRWHLIDDNFYDNILHFSVIGGADQKFKLKLYSPLRISQNPVCYDSGFYFIDSIINSGGTAAFSGSVGIAIYDAGFNMKGIFGEGSLALNNGYHRSNFQCHIPAGNGLEEGAYTASLAYRADGDSNWHLLGNEDYPNSCEFRIIRMTRRTLSVIAKEGTMGSVSGGCVFYGDTTVTISATPNQGYRFLYWDDGIKENQRIVSVYSDTTFTAFFEMADGIGERDATPMLVYSTRGEIIVRNAESKPLWIYDITGRLLYHTENVPRVEHHIPLSVPGVYIVRIGQEPPKKVIVP